MQPPPRDAAGRVIPHDHEEIAPDDGIIRRISEKQIVVDRQGRRRVSSIAFKPSGVAGGGMSVDLEALIQQAGLEPKEFVTTPRWIGSVRFTAGALRGIGLQVGYDPLDESNGFEPNPFHGEVWGSQDSERREELKRLAVWYVPIIDVILEDPA